MKTRTLDERVFGRVNTPDRRSVKDKVRYRFGTPQYHVRAELERLARKIRKLERYTPESGNVFVYYEDVLALLREAKR